MGTRQTYAVKIFDKQKEFAEPSMVEFHQANAQRESLIYVSFFLSLGKNR